MAAPFRAAPPYTTTRDTTAIAYRLEDVEAFEARRRHEAAAAGRSDARGGQ